MSPRKTIPAAEIAGALRCLAEGIGKKHRTNPQLVLLGIARGGVAVCQRVAQAVATIVGHAVPEGVINVSFHRDDLGRNPIPDLSEGTTIPVDIEGATVVLIDDVLFSGRTARAAMEEVFAHGRPARVELAVLIDRGNRCLPIAADYVGLVETTTADERVRVVLDDADPARDTVTISARK